MAPKTHLDLHHSCLNEYIHIQRESLVPISSCTTDKPTGVHRQPFLHALSLVSMGFSFISAESVGQAAAVHFEGLSGCSALVIERHGT